MKKYLITAVMLFCTVSYLFAQNNNKSNRSEVTVSKGYYSIYKNSEKLNNRRPLTTVTIDTSIPAENTHTKGFYAIGDNHKNVHRSGKSFIAITPRRPVATKGFYSVQPPVKNVPVNNGIPAEIAITDKTVVNAQDSVQADR